MSKCNENFQLIAATYSMADCNCMHPTLRNIGGTITKKPNWTVASKRYSSKCTDPLLHLWPNLSVFGTILLGPCFIVRELSLNSNLSNSFENCSFYGNFTQG